MKCSKCGKEIKEGNSFCTNCGTPVNETENNKDIIKEETKDVKGIETNTNINNAENKTKKKSNKLKIIVPIVVIILIVIGIILAIVFTSSDDDTNINNEVVEEQETSKIEIGTNYNCSTYGVTGYINFNSETTYVMNMTYDLSESVTYNGTYEIEENTITLTVTYYDMIENPEEFEPYTETMEILSDGTLKYTSSNGDTYIFDKNITLSDESTETTTEDLLEQIYALYPSLEGTEGIICTDGTDYWLLDEDGNKVYFTDLTSFEEALTQCNISIEELENNINNNNVSNTSTGNNETTSSTSTNNGSSDIESSSSANSSSTTGENNDKWTVNIEIGEYSVYTYNGVATGVKYSTWSTNPNAVYYCYLSSSSNITKEDNTNRGVKYYINNEYVADSSSSTFQYTFNSNESVTIKVVAPYIYNLNTGDLVATNATLTEKTFSFNELKGYYDSSNNILRLGNYLIN